LGGRGRRISEFEASLVYKVSSRTAKVTQRNPVSKKTNQPTNQPKTKTKTKQKTNKKTNTIYIYIYIFLKVLKTCITGVLHSLLIYFVLCVIGRSSRAMDTNTEFYLPI
jgi:hypothetical protein